ncbi:potassium-transporting ATPase subunit KdpC [Pseudomonas sp. NPDC007930]|uniref:potassium-transporting ATPase subunit KdpC n=1 Tax=Pseudomonas sp. NPDC007930 TaxID=3364417 RepID=UPI0036F14C08
MQTLVRPALMLLLALSLITGVAYPLLVTAVARLAFAEQAGGSLLRDAQGQVIGSALIAQPFTGAGEFQPRPSAGDYATVASAASNLAPSNPALAQRINAAAAQWAPQGSGPVPLALLTTSGSGLDPDLPPEAALWQAPRIAAARGLPVAAVEQVVTANTRTPWVGPPVVNVLALNRALDRLPSQPQ